MCICCFNVFQRIFFRFSFFRLKLFVLYMFSFLLSCEFLVFIWLYSFFCMWVFILVGIRLYVRIYPTAGGFSSQRRMRYRAKFSEKFYKSMKVHKASSYYFLVSLLFKNLKLKSECKIHLMLIRQRLQKYDPISLAFAFH